MGKKNKAKKQKLIARIIADGRVSGKEAKKAAKKGISLGRIQKAQTKRYTRPQSVFAPQPTPQQLAKGRRGPDSGPGRPAPQKPAYSPLVIQGKAQKVFDQGRTAAGISNTTTTTGGSTGDDTSGTDATVNPYQAEFDALAESNAALQAQLDAIPDFESIFAQQAEEAAAQRQADMQAMQQQQALYMDEMAARNAEAERQRLLTSQTQQANMARSGLTPDFSIGGRARTDLYGTGGFKRRRKIRPATIAQGIAPTTAVAAGATNGNLLNV